MIFRKIFRTEVAYLLGRISTWLYVVVLMGFIMGITLVVTTGDGVFINNTLHITGTTVMGCLILILIGANIAGEAAARDVQMRIYPLVYTTPLTKFNYLGGRFLAAFAVNAMLVFSVLLGLLLSFYLPGLSNGELLPFRPAVYLNVYFLIALPTVFVATALQFTFAALSRGDMASYLASLLLAVFPQLIAISAAKLFENWDLIKLLDPIGVAGILNSELSTWTPTEKNTRLVTLEGMFLWNRILWISVAVGLLWLTWLRFSFTNPVSNSWWTRFKRRSKIQYKSSSEIGIIRTTAISVPQVPRSFGFATYFRQALRVGWTSFKKIVRHPIGLTLVAAIAIASAIFGYLILNEHGIPLLPTTQQVIGYLFAPVSNVGSPWVVIPLLIMFFVGELVWQEREAGLSDVADAAPIKDWALLAGKFLGLSLIIITWIAILMAGGILMQLYLGYEKLELGLYIKTLFGLQMVDYLLFTVLAFVVHVIVNQKHIGYLLVLLVFGFMAFPSKFGVEHNMLIFGANPGWWYTDMRGFGSTLGPWLLFKLYWMAWALLLAVAARLLWVRGRENSLKYRLQSARRRFEGSTLRIAIIGAGLLFTMGSFVFYNTNILNEYLSSSDIVERKAEYERKYEKYRNASQPQLVATKLQVELYPDRQEARISGTYTLVNKDSVSIDSIHIGSVSGSAFEDVTFNRPATGVIKDKELSYHIYALEKPLLPGDSLELNFVVNHKPQGFSHSGKKALVVENGTYFTNFDLLPSIGYQSFREISDPLIRQKQNLSARPDIPSLYNEEARKRPLISDQTTLEAIIGTAKDEIAVAPGVLIKSWTEGNRNYFHYKTDASIGAEYSILSSNYKVEESNWNDVVIRIYYHPEHDQNIDLMLRSAKESLEYYSEEFGPYPFKNLAIIERAGPGAGATADAGIIYYGEQYPLLQAGDGTDGFNLPYYIMAHEIGHQWWGLARLTPANVEGAGVLIEGLSVYSGMQVLEKAYGENQLQQYVEYLHSSYEMPRSLASASLLQADEDFLYYRKGGLSMYVLSEYIGKEKVNFALRNLLQKRESQVLPHPTTLDLFKELQTVTPDSLNYLLHDLFRENTYWRLKTKQFAAEPTETGNWQVTLKVEAQKIIVDSTGSEHEVPMNDWLEIGIYEEGKGLDEPLYLKMRRIKSGEQTIKITVPRKPNSGGIDPNHLMIDLRRDDNTMQLDG